MAKTKKKEDDGIRVKSTPAFKLKDKDKRQFQAINLVKQFGFVPEVIIVEKVRGSNNTIMVRAVLTAEEIVKEDKLLKEIERKNKKVEALQKGAEEK